ncbi:hypothetical protein PoB_004207600 [Plakobranchus ocellatus]|uniref:Uncharacterized protein n=1 Tax=Plakobranchus ocellatus TaxID=259542 RepID=A0AAV4B9T1_9GAST|nr:hypothetical protein PoB_004207600 [Plakobranchus ocellatus]
MEELPLLEEAASTFPLDGPVPRGKPALRMSMRRKLWKQNRKLKRGMTCDTILFKPPPELFPFSISNTQPPPSSPYPTQRLHPRLLSLPTASTVFPYSTHSLHIIPYPNLIASTLVPYP